MIARGNRLLLLAIPVVAIAAPFASACRSASSPVSPPPRETNETFVPMPTATPFGGPVVISPGEKFMEMPSPTPFGGPVPLHPTAPPQFPPTPTPKPV